MSNRSAVTNKDLRRNARGAGFKLQLGYYAMAAIPLLFVLVFSYIPMLGNLLAFFDYKPARGIFASKWVGLDNFEMLVRSIDFKRIVSNTLMYNLIRTFLLQVVVGILVAVLLYEIRSRLANKFFQTAMLLPSFLSWTVVAAALLMLLHPQRGVINNILLSLGMESVSWYTEPGPWPVIVQLCYIFKSAGMASIYFYAALLSVDTELFDAASIDGANRVRQIWHISIPAVTKVLAITLISNIGNVLDSGVSPFLELTFDSKALYPTTQVIGTYVYNGVTTGRFSFTAAVTTFQALIGFVLVLIVNGIVKKIDPDSAMF